MITHEALTAVIKVHAGTLKARLGLYFLTALESILFPIPIDPLLAACVFARSDKWISIAVLTTFWSVVGGGIGWYLGFAMQGFVSDMLQLYRIKLPAQKNFLLFQKRSTDSE